MFAGWRNSVVVSRCVLLLWLSIPSLQASAQNSPANQWTWTGGSSVAGCTIFNGVNFCGVPGQYGVQGVAMASNTPGSRTNAATWTDQNGHLWLFGGNGYDSQFNFGFLNDLWEFDPSTNEWTWQGGSQTMPRSIPTAPACNMNLGDEPCAAGGVYGTKGVAAAGNIPASHAYGASWSDNKGNFWLFGGDGLDTNNNYGYMNDLWEYSPSTGQWTWVAGSDLVDQPGVYGKLGTPAAANSPGGRYSPITWVDSSHNLWLFGGAGLDATGNTCYLNDLWEFDTSVNQWTWMGGVSTVTNTVGGGCGQPGVYGTQGAPTNTNLPGGRKSGSGWTDSSGNLWLFGGWGFDSASLSRLNDLWKFNPATRQWTWMNGSSTGDAAGSSGTLGRPASGNSPASRQPAGQWVDGTGNFWLFGGDVWFDDSCQCTFNDLWEVNPATNEWAWMDGSILAGFPGILEVPGQYGVHGISAAANTPGSRTDSMNWTDKDGNLWMFGGQGYDANNKNGALNDLWKYQTIAGSSRIFPSVSATLATTNPTTIEPVTFSVTVAGGNGNPVPTGSVTLNYGNTNSESATLSGGVATATLPSGVLPAGTDTIATNYTPDSNSSSTYFAAYGSTSTAITAAPSFSVVGTVTSISPGQSAANSSKITVEPIAGFTGNVALTASVTSSPVNAVNPPTLSFGSTSPVSITNSAAGTATLTISTTAPKTNACSAENTKPGGPSFSSGGGVVMAVLLFFGAARRRKHWCRLLGASFLFLAVLSSLTACGGGGGGSACSPTVTPGTTPGTYQITVTGTSGALTASTTFQLTIE